MAQAIQLTEQLKQGAELALKVQQEFNLLKEENEDLKKKNNDLLLKETKTNNENVSLKSEIEELKKEVEVQGRDVRAREKLDKIKEENKKLKTIIKASKRDLGYSVTDTEDEEENDSDTDDEHTDLYPLEEEELRKMIKNMKKKYDVLDKIIGKNWGDFFKENFEMLGAKKELIDCGWADKDDFDSDVDEEDSD